MDTKQKSQEVQLSEVVFSWKHPDYVAYTKNKWWYLHSGLLLMLAVAWTFYDKNYLFGLFLILFYLVILLYENRQPKIIDFIITPVGIMTDKSFYKWRDIDNFYIIYQAYGIKNLYIEFKNILNGRLIVPLDGQNAVAIREYLLNFLTEDLEREAEPISEKLRRFLKI